MSLARAWVLATEGAITEAVAELGRAAELARSEGAPAFEVLVHQTAAQFGHGGGAARLTELAGVVEGPRAAIAAVHADAVQRSDPRALARASEAFEAMGDLLAAADAAAQTSAVLDAAGDSRGARVPAARAATLAERCQGARTPALQAGLQPLPLTAREREIVTLAARGFSNRQIADRLVLSERTVEGHVYRASAKLGLERRTQFADVLLLRG